MNAPFDHAAKLGIVPVIAIERASDAIALADALLEGGLPLAEITFRTVAAAEVIAIMAEKRPELLVGAGTILTPEALAAAIGAGARFGLAPGFDAEIVAAAKTRNFPFAPGIMTPSDLTAVSRKGLKLAKFFPAKAAGGPAMLEAISAPFAHLGTRFVPTGGVSIDNMHEWLKLGAVAAVGGTWIATKADIGEGRWTDIAAKARAAVARARDVREANR
ncbi:bifunctional 4-hydroxy-2-oxoglutarate aldolase/2-dehydro-3-deoxy-phosphogluconate aldolase [Sinorhizobium medicae]|uniref:bifunctional 4-hydroxy-2-oxoglutarate aldolase/2-dehydro-3-deoxy-phosphogluconate aldolase n=1 Tax=Sinorhizobium medicae TaxID=110321 RepID=UPI000C7BE682|nr:bifunctional 4-hydroxy-2-oxoglutarate aldolase/2-dehydro-3-deoxy-phosphogluconate aldolase [Sinorhizobium medicae]MDX0422810.1 bifunctional 4-hydroxy-2-oxoglutarate aldolase/2-dehydro-3-deoxy-phosphogluconate aldolase [Sinorhizobium medicae]PLT97385.1 2-dehydro-3-deoxyphosphogluconate aldolase [Sinorhizobium medicae]PLU55313.1 2-dehydro-3-deoxyphosphogluconate aldolase [Sinorhizobium medicae]PLU71313.1 2-dehydro-3-deoxyphosphogluconate aldolase [Sinorhizobium medicae]TWA29081.1 2-keto-3-deo